MSDFILKLWPKEQIKENKRELLEAELKTHGLVSEPATHWSGKAFHATKELRIIWILILKMMGNTRNH
jgi:hypothetical protein